MAGARNVIDSINRVDASAIKTPPSIADIVVLPFNIEAIANIELTKNPVRRYNPIVVYNLLSLGKYEKKGESFEINTTRDPGITLTLEGSKVGNS